VSDREQQQQELELNYLGAALQKVADNFKGDAKDPVVAACISFIHKSASVKCVSIEPSDSTLTPALSMAAAMLEGSAQEESNKEHAQLLRSAVAAIEKVLSEKNGTIAKGFIH
jgi:hypothetical protein